MGVFVDKTYAFELDIPRGTNRWFQVVCSYELDTLSTDVKGRTFSHCIGTTYSALETFLITKKVKGPCWMRFAGVKETFQPISTRKMECRVDYTVPSNVAVMPHQLPTPPFSIACLSLKTSQQVVLRGTEGKKEYRKQIFNISLKYHSGVNVELANTEELSAFKAYSFITHVDQTKSLESIAKKGSLTDSTKFCASEASLLDNFLNKFAELDPDIIVGHDFYQTTMDILLNRLRDTNNKKWTCLARLINIGSSEVPKFGSAVVKAKQATKGRLLIDSMISAQEFVNCIEYTVEALAKKLFAAEINRVDPKSYEQRFATLKTVNSIVEDTLMEIDLAMKIMYQLQVIPLTKQLTAICGNLWTGSLQNQRAERNEMLLLHRFNELNFVNPDNFKNLPKAYKRRQKQVQVRQQYDGASTATAADGNRPAKKRQNKFKGGQVFEPQKGLYNEFIVLLDFNSLYPSIIQEFNVCFTTCKRDAIPLVKQLAPFIGQRFQKNDKQEAASDEEDALMVAVAASLGDVIPEIEQTKEIAPLPAILSYLVQQRKLVKNEMKKTKNEKDLEALEIKQKAFKLVANSLYGCLGFSSSRFYAMPLAAFITAKGRQILVDSKQVVTDLGHEVIYGDTDSLMVRPNTNDLLEAVKVGLSVKVSVNKKYKKLQLEIDGIFKNMLLLKKKKYATLKVINWEEAYKKPDIPLKVEKEVKGIDVVRRDWCQLSRDAGNRVLEIILQANTSEDMLDDIKKYLSNLNDEINQKKVKTSYYYITKRLTKRIDQYGEKNLPHVEVARRIIEERNIDPQSLVNQIINYIICGEGSGRLVDKAYSPQEFLNKNRSLEVDYAYYKRYQLFEPIKRLFEVIQDINLSEIGNLLEISYQPPVQAAAVVEVVLDSQQKRLEHLKFVPKLILACPKCGHTDAFVGYLNEPGTMVNILKCSATNCIQSLETLIQNKVQLALKQLIRQFDEMQLQQHEDDDFEFTHALYMTSTSRPVLKHTNQSLNANLLALQAMFTSPAAAAAAMSSTVNSANAASDEGAEYNPKIKPIKDLIDEVVTKSKYNYIDITQAFKLFGLFA